jgi:hypothetical protein
LIRYDGTWVEIGASTTGAGGGDTGFANSFMMMGA